MACSLGLGGLRPRSRSRQPRFSPCSESTQPTRCLFLKLSRVLILQKNTKIKKRNVNDVTINN